MYAKRIWAYSLLCYCLLLGITATAAWAGPARGQDAGGARACRLVELYGGQRGGPQTIGSLMELNMRQWKPQSNRGIGVLGWRAEKLDQGVYRVVYAYQEIGLKPVEVPWRVELADGRITPLTPLSQRIQRMSLLL
ncbi:MAG: hypothetical protein K9K66_11860 [Desulfarculaceae bacterium]|nr:hypothetical protein [Desulfarculaceae bacterium]MCF8071526.1 hypothetical protein [Desulfarculaceae bacterium]MCF8102341.1 hypothetical protein [Desulfarculaceae bacterium]MCF8114805.1 hypothetical protein [Desulfarculaceae bacterium]